MSPPFRRRRGRPPKYSPSEVADMGLEEGSAEPIAKSTIDHKRWREQKAAREAEAEKWIEEVRARKKPAATTTNGG